MSHYENITMKDIVNFCITRGFIYPNSEIYGGLANTWDYGPLGVEIKRKIKDLWWKFFIQTRLDMVGLDSAILTNPKVWEASGHLGNFTDPLIDCRKCRSRFRADHLIENFLHIPTGEMNNLELEQKITQEQISCPDCGAIGEFTSIRQFNLMFQTKQGVTEENSATIYLRPETAQEIFIQYKNILQSTRKKIPFGVGQIGKSFRNEVTPGNFIFRTREFEQMEIEYFIHPSMLEEKFAEWILLTQSFFIDKLGIHQSLIRVRKQEGKELAHYAKMTSDIEFEFPFGWGEIAGVAHRGNFDLTVHQEASAQNLEYIDPYTQEKYLPEVIEPSFGADRAFLALIASSYKVEELSDGKNRNVLGIPYYLAPIAIAVLPLKKNEPRIVKLAQHITTILSEMYSVMYDDTGSIGKLYRRQDEIGTPFCITVDFDSLEDNTVTIRNRDTMEQERIPKDQLLEYLNPFFRS